MIVVSNTSPILEQLESEAGFYLSQEITDYALELAGE